MKLTLAPTESWEGKVTGEFPSISIEVSADDLDIYEVWDKLIEPALLGWGFQPGSIDDLLNKEDASSPSSDEGV